MNGFRISLDKIYIARGDPLSIPLNGFSSGRDGLHSKFGSIISIPLNGFEPQQDTVFVVSIVVLLSIPLNGFKLEEALAPRPLFRSFNSIEWILKGLEKKAERDNNLSIPLNGFARAQ